MTHIKNVAGDNISQIVPYLSWQDARSFSAVNREYYTLVSNDPRWSNDCAQIFPGVSPKLNYDRVEVLKRRLYRANDTVSNLYHYSLYAVFALAEYNKRVSTEDLSGSAHDPLTIFTAVLAFERISLLQGDNFIKISRLVRIWGVVGVSTVSIYSGVALLWSGNPYEGTKQILGGSILASHCFFSRDQKQKFLSSPVIKCVKIWTQIQLDDPECYRAFSPSQICSSLIKYIGKKVTIVTGNLKESLVRRLIPHF